MSFLTERYFQVLDGHGLYGALQTRAQLRTFMEHHVICVWGYHHLLRHLHQRMISYAQPVNSDPYKEALRLINEIVLEEEVDDRGNGQITSHLEIYLDAMRDVGCDLGPTFSLFDLIEGGISPQLAIKQSGFPPAASNYGLFLMTCLGRPMHVCATALFYEGEPYIPDQYLNQLATWAKRHPVGRLLEYWESHIEGLKRPGFSAAGRLVEILCGHDKQLNREAERMAETLLQARICLWEAIKMDLPAPLPTEQVFSGRQVHLRVVT